MGRRLDRLGLWLLTGAVPVFIAACYGAQQSFTRFGRVIDAQTKAPIPGILLSCASGGSSFTATSAADGGFAYGYAADAAPCTLVRAEDVDGADNGGPYQTVEVPVPESGEIDIEMSP